MFARSKLYHVSFNMKTAMTSSDRTWWSCWVSCFHYTLACIDMYFLTFNLQNYKKWLYFVHLTVLNSFKAFLPEEVFFMCYCNIIRACAWYSQSGNCKNCCVVIPKRYLCTLLFFEKDKCHKSMLWFKNNFFSECPTHVYPNNR